MLLVSVVEPVVTVILNPTYALSSLLAKKDKVNFERGFAVSHAVINPELTVMGSSEMGNTCVSAVAAPKSPCRVTLEPSELARSTLVAKVTVITLGAPGYGLLCPSFRTTKLGAIMRSGVESPGSAPAASGTYSKSLRMGLLIRLVKKKLMAFDACDCRTFTNGNEKV
jgi:hypothetical protein